MSAFYLGMIGLLRGMISVLLLSLFGCSKLIEQQSKIAPISQALTNYQKYFSTNQNSLDPIEGIWTEYVVGTLYEDGKVIHRKEVEKRATWIIIKKGATYQILNDYGEQNKFIAVSSHRHGLQFECLKKPWNMGMDTWRRLKRLINKSLSD